MRIEFRCPHRSMPALTTAQREAKAVLRAKRYVAPADTEWTDEGANWSADIRCPDCYDTVHVVTDQDPGGTNA